MASQRNPPSSKKPYAISCRSLRQRNASAHTIKAYSGDLDEFAAYVGSRGWKQIDHVTIRGFLSRLYEKGWARLRWRARWRRCGRSIAGWRRKEWSNRIRRRWCRRRSCQETAASPDDRRDERRARRSDARARSFSRARPHDVRIAVRMRYPEFRTDRHQSRGHSFEQRSDPRFAAKEKRNATFPLATSRKARPRALLAGSSANSWPNRRSTRQPC